MRWIWDQEAGWTRCEHGASFAVVLLCDFCNMWGRTGQAVGLCTECFDDWAMNPEIEKPCFSCSLLQKYLMVNWREV